MYCIQSFQIIDWRLPQLLDFGKALDSARDCNVQGITHSDKFFCIVSAHMQTMITIVAVCVGCRGYFIHKSHYVHPMFKIFFKKNQNLLPKFLFQNCMIVKSPHSICSIFRRWNSQISEMDYWTYAFNFRLVSISRFGASKEVPNSPIRKVQLRFPMSGVSGIKNWKKVKG